MVPVGVEHRLVVIITTVIISALRGSATRPSRGGDGGDRAGVLRGWGLGRAVQAKRLAEGLASWLVGSGQPVGRWELSAARRETLASGWHSGQIRP